MEKSEVIELLNKIEITVNEIAKNNFEIFARIYSYKELNNFFNKTIKEDEYNEVKENLKEKELNIIIEKIKNIEKKVKEDKKEIDDKWNKYNDNYKEYIYSYYLNIFTIIKEYKNLIPIMSDLKYFINKYFEFYRKIINIYTGEEPLKFFSVHNRNYVIFGKNGSGKTKLLNHVKNNCFKNNSLVIPSNRNIEFGKQRDIRRGYKNEKNLSNIFCTESYEGYTNDYLCEMIKDKDYSELQQNKKVINKDSMCIGETKNNTINIFNSLNLERRITFDEDDMLVLYNDEQGVKKYYIKDGSDGEKTIIQFIMFILLCPKNSFVFIDEPETHLNTALLNELFDMLENERKDLRFIYCTHDIDFIESRTNCELVYLNRYDGENWDIKMQNSFDNIPIDIIISIIGTKKDILFVESQENKIDYKFYTTLFPQYKIIAVNSCENVIENCRSVNQNKIFNRKAIGIIDNDYREEQEINKLEKKSIYVLKYNEIENLLMAEPILEYIYKKVLNREDKLEETKKEIIKMAKKAKKSILEDYINKIFFRIQKIEKIKYDSKEDNLENSIDIMNRKNKEKLIKSVEQFSKDLDRYINEEKYEEIIKSVSNKGFISCVSVAKTNKETYENMIIARIKEDEEFKNLIKENYFKEIQ